MPTLRKLIDGVTLEASAPMRPITSAPEPEEEDGEEQGSSGASPVAKHVADHITDPLESTKEGFEGLNEAGLKYEMAKEKMRRNLLPVQSVIQHVAQMHQLDDDGMLGTNPVDPMMNNDPAMGYQQEKQGVPPNMMQKPGMMQQSAPSRNVAYPGAGPKIPTPPMGVPQEQNQQKPVAARPKGAGTMPKKPGAKKPGGAQSGRQIKVHVSATGYPIRSNGMALSKTFEAERLRTMSKVAAGGQGSGCRGSNCGRHRQGTEEMLKQAGYSPKAKAFNLEGQPQTWKHPDHPNEHVQVDDQGWRMRQSTGRRSSDHHSLSLDRKPVLRPKTIERGSHENNDDLRVMIQGRPHDEK